MESKWIRVSKRSLCPICGKHDWCGVTSDGTAAHCMRVESDKATEVGGWIHKLSDPIPVYEAPEKAPAKRLGFEEVTRRAMNMFESAKAPEMREEVARTLGVSVSSLELLYVGYSADYDGKEFSSWPSRNAAGDFIGIVRRYRDGGKRTLRGTSNAGVFAAEQWWTFTGAIWVVEGGSDTAACISRGIAAIGRPSNTGGGKVIAEMIGKRAAGRPVVVFGEQDRKHGLCPVKCGHHCSACWPGYYGATKVMRQLKDALKQRNITIRFPKGKDVREDLQC